MGIIQDAKKQVGQEIINQIDDIFERITCLSNFIAEEELEEDYEDLLNVLDSLEDLLKSEYHKIVQTV